MPSYLYILVAQIGLCRDPELGEAISHIFDAFSRMLFFNRHSCTSYNLTQRTCVEAALLACVALLGAGAGRGSLVVRC